ncbi:MAG: DUF4097 family beta strand repeat-containing protein [Gemmatimonadaceae bacterium]
MRLSTALCAFLAMSTAAGAQNIVGRNERIFTVTEQVGSGGEIGIFSPTGTITITEASGGSLEFRAEKVRGDAEDVGFVVLRRSRGVTICAVYDEEDECSEDGFRSNRRRNWRNWNDRARVNITVTVPRGTHVHASSGNGEVSLSAAVAEARITSGNGRVRVARVQGQVTATSGNGEVTVDNVGGPVQASSGNGDVSITAVNGPVNASSGNGDILVTMDRLTGRDDLDFSSGNGRIELTVPSDFSAEVEASTGNGRITTDFPIRITGRISPTRLRGTIGDGARRLRMSSGNGSVVIRER